MASRPICLDEKARPDGKRPDVSQPDADVVDIFHGSVPVSISRLFFPFPSHLGFYISERISGGMNPNLAMAHRGAAVEGLITALYYAHEGYGAKPRVTPAMILCSYPTPPPPHQPPPRPSPITPPPVIPCASPPPPPRALNSVRTINRGGPLLSAIAKTSSISSRIT